MTFKDTASGTDVSAPKLLHVLMVEDSESDAELLELQLTKCGYRLSRVRVTTKRDFEKALLSRTWDMVIADYAVPGFGAMAALEILRHTNRDIPFIVVSGVITDEIAVAAMRAGAHDYVLKDNLARLAPAVERELQEAQTRRQKREIEAALQLQVKALQAAANAIVITDRNGTIEWVNAAFTQLSGYAPEEVLGQNPRLLNSGEHDAQFFRTMWDTIVSGAVWRGEVTNRRKDGSTYVEEMTITPVSSGDGEICHFVAVKEDVTERKRTQAALAQRAEEVERLLEAVPVAVWVAHDPQCLRMTANRTANELFEAIEGENLSAGMAGNPRRYFAPGGRELLPSELPMQIVAATNKDVRDAEFCVELPSGRQITVLGNAVPLQNESGEVRGCIGAFTDITGFKQTQQALLQSEERFRVAQELSPDGFTILHPLRDQDEEVIDFTWVYENAAIARMNGTDPKTIVGKRLLDVFPGHRGSPFFAAYQHVAQTRQHHVLEAEYPEDNLPTKWFRVAVVPMGDDIAILAQDITERKRAEQALTKSEQRVRAKLENIISPEGDLGNLELRDIIDVPALQSLFEQFYAVSRMPTAILDLKGNVLVGVGWQDVCTKFHRVNPQTCQYCVESDTELSAEVPAGEYKLYQCKNHMWDVVTPIIVGDKHFGNIFSGQFFFEDESPDVEFFREQARRFGFPEAEYIAALERVPRLSREALATSMAYLMKLAEMISKLSYSNLKLARSLAERDRLAAALREREQRVREQAERMTQLAATAEEQKDRMDFALRAAGFGEWEIDLTTRKVSRSYRQDQIFGYGAPLPEWSYELFLEHVLPEHRAEVDRNFKAAVASCAPWQVETPIRRPDGAIRWIAKRARVAVDETGNATRMIGITMDITQRKEAEISRQERERQLLTILEALPVGAVLYDANGRIIQANAAAESMWGGKVPRLEPEEYGRLKGRWPGKDGLLTPEQWPLTRALHKCETVLNEELEVEVSDGNRKTMLLNALPIREHSGAIAGAVGVSVDITNRKETERALIRSEKLASVGRMAATIAHEINNPLAAAMNAMFLVGTDPGLTDTARENIQLAERELERVAHIAKQALGFYKEGAGVARPVHLPQMLDELLQLYGSKVNNSSTTLKRRYRAKGDIHAVEGEARQIVSNLVANSLDAMVPGGTLHFRTIGPVSLKGRPMVCVTIADTGTGISADHLAHIFEPFFTTKQSIGTGLGLWVTKELVRKNDGAIRVRSKVGKGTVFTVWLPQERRADQRSSTSEAAD